MKQLLLIRHAKSSWANPDLADFDRPLNKRGKRDAPYMGKLLAAQGISPELIITSPAKRAKRTAKTIAAKIGYDEGSIIYREDIYMSGLSGLLKAIASTDNSINSLALVGHNYAITELAEWLTGKVIGNIPTCGIVSIEFRVPSWKKIIEHSGRLIFFDYPKLHTVRSKGE
ncbi:MAG: histidine phosphatase family protein [Desulfobacterales bacterium]|nr:histidine phosphatase family protein [Desulfobacterales bacterium]